MPTTYPVTFSYYVTIQLWPLILKNQKHFSLIVVIYCIMLYDPGAYGLFCILSTTFCYYVTIRPWPLTPTLKNNKHSHHVDQKRKVRPTRPGQTDGQTDGRCYTIIRPVKNRRIKKNKFAIWNVLERRYKCRTKLQDICKVHDQIPQLRIWNLPTTQKNK